MVDVLSRLAGCIWRMMKAELLITLGAALFLIGSTHLHPAVALGDTRLFGWLHTRLQLGTPLLRILWHLGRTPFALLMLALLSIYNLQTGIISTIIFILIVTFEWMIKRIFRRPRPFTVLDDAKMRQPSQPNDSSFPSGDALRVWFFALILPASFELPIPLIVGTCFVAFLVTLGRIAMGVHYPLDALAGAGLGVLGAGLSINIL